MFNIKEIESETLVDSLLILQEKIYLALQEKGHTDYILPKSREDYQALINDPMSSIVGIFNEDNKLIGQLVVKKSEHKASEYSELDLGQELYEVANLLIDPDYNGKGLAKKMIELVKSMPKYQDSTLTAEIEITNLASTKSFLGSGFVVVNTEKSPIDGAEISILAFNHHLNEQIFDDGFVEISQHLKYEDYEELTSAGLVTVGYKKSVLEDGLEADVFIMKKSKALLKIEEAALKKWKKKQSKYKTTVNSELKSLPSKKTEHDGISKNDYHGVCAVLC